MLFSSLSYVLFLVFLAGVVVRGRASSTKPVLRTVTQFPNLTWVENLAVRSNGQVLVTLLTTPELVLVDPFNDGKQVVVHQFPNVVGLTGIAEIAEDVFAVASGNFSVKTFSSTPG
jgi:hypothetical protein